MQIGGLPSTKPRSIFRNSAIPKSIGNPCASDLGLKICAGAPAVGFVEWSVCFWIQDGTSMLQPAGIATLWPANLKPSSRQR